MHVIEMFVIKGNQSTFIHLMSEKKSRKRIGAKLAVTYVLKPKLNIVRQHRKILRYSSGAMKQAKLVAKLTIWHAMASGPFT